MAERREEIFPRLPKPERWRRLTIEEKRNAVAEMGAASGGVVLGMVGFFRHYLPLGGLFADAIAGAGIGFVVGSRGYDMMRELREL